MGKEGCMRVRHWQDVVSLLLGAWLIVSPLVLGLSDAPQWVTMTLGLCVVMFAIDELLLPSYAEEFCEAGIGALLVLAPWVLGYGATAATYNSAATGALVMILAIWELLTDREFVDAWRQFRHRSRA